MKSNGEVFNTNIIKLKTNIIKLKKKSLNALISIKTGLNLRIIFVLVGLFICFWLVQEPTSQKPEYSTKIALELSPEKKSYIILDKSF